MSAAAAAAMVVCVSCGNKLMGRYCDQCGEDSESQSPAVDRDSRYAVLHGPPANVTGTDWESKTKKKPVGNL